MATGYPDFSYPLLGISNTINPGTINTSGNIGAYTEEEVDATAGDITRTLPAASTHRGYAFKIQKTDSGGYVVNIAAGPGDQILVSGGPVSSVTLRSQAEYIWLTSAGGTLWYEG